MPTIKYPKNPNIDTAFVEQEDGTKNRALMTAPQDISTLEYPNNPNSTKGYVTVDGKKQRVILTADITGSGGGGSGLPDQTGHSGKFLTTDGTDASWDNTLTENILFSKTTVDIASLGTGNIGYLIIPIRNNKGGIEFRSRKGVVNSAMISVLPEGIIPNYSSPGGDLGSSTNKWYHTYTTIINNGNDITVPTTSGTMAVIQVDTTATLTSAGWSGGSQTIIVSGISATGIVFVSPDPTDQAAYTSAGIVCTAQAADSLTFTATSTPASDLTVNVVML